MSHPNPLYTEYALSQMAQMISPNVTVIEHSEYMQFYTGARSIGRISFSKLGDLETWHVVIQRHVLLAKNWPDLEVENGVGAFKTPSEAVRHLLSANNAPDIWVKEGVPGNDQASSFENATMQQVGNFEYSIATRLRVPECVVAGGVKSISKYIKSALKRASVAVPNLGFEVQVGEQGEGAESDQ